MYNTITLQIVIIAVILFVLVNYFISSSHDSTVIEEIIAKRKEEDEDPEDFYYSMEQMKAKYLKEKFRIYITRGIFFGGSLWFAIVYLQGQNNQINKTYPIPQHGIVLNNQAPVMPNVNINPIDIPFFERPNWM